MAAPETTLRDRIGERFSVPVMILPESPEADGGPVRTRELSPNVVEILDGVGRRRVITYREGRVVRMETSILGARGLYERVDQRKEDERFVSAFVVPGKMPRVRSWAGELLVKVERGLINYVTYGRERLYETADGKIVQERTTRSGAHVFAWFDPDGCVRSKQIHDAAGHRHFLAYDRTGLAKLRLDDGTELTRGAHGLWQTATGEPITRLELMEDGSIRWCVDRVMQEVRGDGTRACRIERDGFTEFVRFDDRGDIVSSIRASTDATGAEKTVVRDRYGIVSIRISVPRKDGGYDLRSLERARRGEQQTWRMAAVSPPGKTPEIDRRALLPASGGRSGYLIATIDDLEDGIIYSFPDATGMYLEHTDGTIERVA
jgi:hypothetical protein